MASLCNISSSYFSKLFNRITGETFTNYVNTLRVERARELLDEGDTRSRISRSTSA
jgi:AraC-like DNA-binding protein